VAYFEAIFHDCVSCQFFQLLVIIDWMSNFELIDHTADVGISAGGDTLNEAFAGAGEGLFSIMADLSKIVEKESREIVVEGPDIEGLLFNWINELLYLFEVEQMLFCRFTVGELTDNYMRATCFGDKYDPGIHSLKLEVKSATFHQLKVDRANNKVSIILDV
jgi:SHS2 domain-containing protein